MSIAFQQPVSSVHQLTGHSTPYVSQQYSSHMGSDYNHNQSHLTSTPSVATAPSNYNYTSHPAETASSDQPAVAYQPNSQELRSSTSYSSSATPSSEYGIKPEYGLNSSQRPSNFAQDYGVASRSYPENRYPPASNGASAAHPESSEDTSITTAANPPYPSQPHYPSYQQPPDMSQAYPQQSGGAPQQYHPNWSNQGYPAPQFPPYAHPGVSAPPSGGSLTAARSPMNVDKTRRKRNSNEQAPMSQVYSFIPIPGAQQHKRPRRRYEEIERMYKCGHQGCEKAYGTLNHLNAHVTMQGHGVKRTPEEFKEVRKEWKARKKEEEAQRKAEEEASRVRQTDTTASVDAPAPPASTATYPAIPPRQLPPIGYQAQGVSSVPHYAQPSSGIDTMQPYAPAGPLYPPYNGTPYNHSQGSTIYTPPRQQPSQANAGEVDADAEPDPDVPSGGYAQ